MFNFSIFVLSIFKLNAHEDNLKMKKKQLALFPIVAKCPWQYYLQFFFCKIWIMKYEIQHRRKQKSKKSFAVSAEIEGENWKDNQRRQQKKIGP